MLPPPPAGLQSGPVILRFDRIVHPDNPLEGITGLVPFYHFKIMTRQGQPAGHINFRVGDTPHILQCAGHIGYEILAPFRGQGFAYHACIALKPFIQTRYERVIITCAPGNTASIKIIKKLGACFINEICVPPDDPAYQSGARKKKRYEWNLE